MRIVCITNEAQLPMMKNMLRSAEESGIPMQLFHCYILMNSKDVETYRTPVFNKMCMLKLQKVLENLSNKNTEVLWVDNDIVFFKNCIDYILQHKNQLVFQNDEWAPCSGFTLYRNTPDVKSLLRDSIDYIKRNDYKVHDQDAIQQLLKTKPCDYALLPLDTFPNGSHFSEVATITNQYMIHNNYLTTTEAKVERFKQYSLWNPVFDLAKVSVQYCKL
jgi:hypothetical protein